MQQFRSTVGISLRFNDYLEIFSFLLPPLFFSDPVPRLLQSRTRFGTRDMRDEWKRWGVIGTTKRGYVAIRISRSGSVTRITLFLLWNNAREVRSWDSVIYGPLYISIRLGQLLGARIFVTRAQLGDRWWLSLGTSGLIVSYIIKNKCSWCARRRINLIMFRRRNYTWIIYLLLSIIILFMNVDYVFIAQTFDILKPSFIIFDEIMC